MTTDSYARDIQTAAKVAGVRTDPTHWANAVVHAFRTWTGESTAETWCGLDVDFVEQARQTTDTITCLQCSGASYRATREWVAQIRWVIPTEAAPPPRGGWRR